LTIDQLRNRVSVISQTELGNVERQTLETATADRPSPKLCLKWRVRAILPVQKHQFLRAIDQRIMGQGRPYVLDLISSENSRTGFKTSFVASGFSRKIARDNTSA
jgi:hypothetical protein